MLACFISAAEVEEEVRPEIFGDKENAEYQMKIQYCGGWQGRRHADAVRREVDKKFPGGSFYFSFYRDDKPTGRMNVLIGKKDAEPNHSVHNK